MLSDPIRPLIRGDAYQLAGRWQRLEMRRPVKLTRLVVVTDAPGWRAQIRAGASETGPFAPVSPSRTTAATTVFPLKETAPMIPPIEAIPKTRAHLRCHAPPSPCWRNANAARRGRAEP